MHATRKITTDISWVGADNRRGGLFEGVYSVPFGVSYNSYLISDEKTALIDTVDRSVTDAFFENLEHALDGRKLDYLVVQHMEPDHSATLTDCLMRYPECTVVCNKKTFDMIAAFTGKEPKAMLINDKDVLELGNHKLTFIPAPMVHWPEVTVTHDTYDGTLYSADAFGTFGNLGGAIFADEVNFDRDYLDEARRYYCNIAGKYGTPVSMLLNKLKNLDIKRICPLHGFVWRENIAYYVNKYMHWSSYTPEEEGAVIAYASVYGNTERVANAVACKLFEKGVKCVMFDTSVTEPSYIIAGAFKYSHLIFASPTYNCGIFVKMENLLRDLANHSLAGRKIAFIDNGSWASAAAKQMREILSPLKDTEFIDASLTVKSAMHANDEVLVEAFVEAIVQTFKDGERLIGSET